MRVQFSLRDTSRQTRAAAASEPVGPGVSSNLRRSSGIATAGQPTNLTRPPSVPSFRGNDRRFDYLGLALAARAEREPELI